MSTKPLFDSFLTAVAKSHSRWQFQRFMRAARRAVQVQERVLLSKIARNADSAYGREHRFARIRTYEDFVRRVPVQTYDDIQPYVERVMAGELNALFGRGQRVLMFAMTSGSTDEPKYVPVTSHFLNEYRRGWNVFGVKALLDHPGGFMRPILRVVSPMDEHHTRSGVPCGSISGLLAGSQKYVVRKYYATPAVVAYIPTPDARYYTIMRLAVPRDVAWMITASPATQVKLARMASAHAERLIRDVHDGTLSPPSDLPDAIKRALRERIRPEPQTGHRLAALAERYGELLPKHYWNLVFIANWTAGTLGLHLRDFPHYYGDTPVRDLGLLATEGRVSICIEDGTPAGVLDVAGSFFEFVDTGAGASGPSAVYRSHELLPGKEYRVVMTTSAGFYRYDLGDRVRVHGYLGEAPIVEFLDRGAYVSSVTGEKLTEWQVTTAFQRSRRSLGLGVDNFVLAPHWADPPFYRLHVDTDVPDMPRLATLLDAEISRLNLEYASKRSSGRLGPIQPHRLPDGLLARLDADRLRRRGASNEQYKHRYLYTRPGDDAGLLVAGWAGDQLPVFDDVRAGC